MRRGAGIGAIKNKSLAQDKFKSKSTAMAGTELEQMSKQISVFKSYLEDFAAKHRHKIKEKPELRAQFQQMCAVIGVDPLASSKGFWSEMLGVGDYYYELGIKIIEISMATSHRNGGLLDVEELRQKLNKSKSSHENTVSLDDIVRAIKKLSVLGNGYNLINLGSHQFVQSVPGELSMDQTSVLMLAEENGSVTADMCISRLNWTPERTDKALSVLVKEGIAWIDNGGRDNVTIYWIPSLFQSLHCKEFSELK